ncbi:unnamed protein product [Moneuplotes crassus]|uniref:Major facilitator superfamily (MFS) profile domain-containing protein n=1 Tax=Euplotes crassus TaxID=5936 RepID=A0AAD1U393_EUPCR|nr:unnamed protein product [Moneuplotes crassus]
MLSKNGKRKTLIISSFITLVGSSIAMANRIEAFMISRSITGIGFGITNATSPLFIHEIAPKKWRAALLCIILLWINIGFTLPLVLQFYFPRFDAPDTSSPDYCEALKGKHIIWRELEAMPIILSFIQFIALFMVFRKENPIYRQHLECKSGSLGTSEESGETESGINYEIQLQQSKEKSPSRIERDTWTNLWKPTERRKLIASLIIRGVGQLLGINVLLNFSILFTIGEDPRYNLRFFLSAIACFHSCLAMVVHTLVKRKPLLLCGTLICCFICSLLFQLTGNLERRGEVFLMFDGYANTICTISLAIFGLTFIIMNATIVHVYCTDVLTDKGMSVATSGLYFFNSFTRFLPTLALNLLGWFGGETTFINANRVNFFMFSGFAIVGFFLILIFVKETFNKSRAEITQEFGKEFYSNSIEIIPLKTSVNY